MTTPNRPVFYDPEANTITGNSLGDVLDAWDSKAYQVVRRPKIDPLLSFGKTLCEVVGTPEQFPATPSEGEGV